MRSGLFHDFVMQFDHCFPKDIQDGRAPGSQVIVTSSSLTLTNSRFGSQPAVSLEAFQKWVERAGTDVVAVPAEFGKHPLPDERMLSGVMQDMHLPEAQQDLSRQQFGIRGGHQESPLHGYYDARKRI